MLFVQQATTVFGLRRNGFRDMGVVTALRGFTPGMHENQLVPERRYRATVKKFPSFATADVKKQSIEDLRDQLDLELLKIKPALGYLAEKILEFHKGTPIQQIFIDDSHGRLVGVFVHKVLAAAKVPHKAIYVNVPSATSSKRTCHSYLRTLREEMSRFSGHSIFVTGATSNSGFAIESLYGSASRVTVVSTFFSGRQAQFDMRSRWKEEGSWRGIHTQQSLFDRFTEQTEDGKGMIARRLGASEGYQALALDWLHAKRNEQERSDKELALYEYARDQIEKIALEIFRA